MVAREQYGVPFGSEVNFSVTPIIITANSKSFARFPPPRTAPKDIFATYKGPDPPIPINDTVISPFHEDLIFTKLRMYEASRK